MSLTNIDKITELATKAVEQIRSLTDEQAMNFMIGVIAGIYKEAQDDDNSIKVTDAEIIDMAYKGSLH